MDSSLSSINKHVPYTAQVESNEFLNCATAQPNNTNLDVMLGNLKQEPIFEPGEVIWKTEPNDWRQEDSNSTENTQPINNSSILQCLLQEKKNQTEIGNSNNGLEGDLELERGESFIQFKYEPGEITETAHANLHHDILKESGETYCLKSTDASMLHAATDSIGSTSNGDKGSKEKLGDSETTANFQNGVSELNTNNLPPIKTKAGKRCFSSVTQMKDNQSHVKRAIIYQPNDAAFGNIMLKTKLIDIKNISFAVENTHTNTDKALNAEPFYKRCKKCGDSVFLDLNHFVNHLRHHSNSKMYCMICQKGVSGEIYAERHTELHKKNQVECNECFRFFSTKEQLKIHKLGHKGNTPFKCENCPTKFFLTFQQIKKHIKKCTAGIYNCNRCKIVCQNKKELKKHSCSAPDLFKCQKCLKLCDSKRDLKTHMESHKNVICTTYNCKLCGTLSNSYQNYLIHRVSHILEYCNEVSKCQKCQICHKKFRSMKQLRIHVKLHSQKKYHCAECHFGYTRQKHVLHHLKVHELLYHQCHQCFSFFKNPHDLTDHERKHRMGPPFYCEFCPKLEFPSILDIKKHIRENHLNYKCGVCNKKFNLHSQLIFHVQTHEKKYPCKKCGKKFARIDYLAKHKTIHTKIRAYKCPECKRKFSRSDNFKVHVKKMHKSDKDYACVCGMKFPHKVLYSMHKILHRGSKSFSCDLCQGKFKRFTEIKKHIMINHLKMAKYTCDVCKENFLKHNSLRSHYDKRHKNLSSVCDVCGKEFDSYSKLKSHKYAHEIEEIVTKSQTVPKKRKLNEKSKRRKAPSTPTYECYHCKTTFKAKRLLKHHILTKHLDVEELDCNLCSQKFLNIASLKNHYCSSHKNENTICDKCGIYFKKFGDFLKHSRIHENGKVRNCNKCEKKFLTAAELKRHYLNTHRNL